MVVKRFTIDPALVREAVITGRTLIVEVSDKHHKVTLGDATAYPEAVARRMRA